jgi:holo-[acyl-carrier protein] synthase
MILGIGIDIVEISRFNQENASDVFLHKVFTPIEIEECQVGINPAKSFAVKFALKEAFMKAIGAGIEQEVWFTNIEVLDINAESPQIIPQKKAKTYYEALKVKDIHVSYSSSSRLAVGVVVLTS